MRVVLFIGSHTRLLNCCPWFYSGHLPCLQWNARPELDCHLGWYFAVRCPLMAAEENKNKRAASPPKKKLYSEHTKVCTVKYLFLSNCEEYALFILF
jgi:hypothetical protein